MRIISIKEAAQDIKNFITKDAVNVFKIEHRRKSYIRLLVLSLYMTISYLLTLLMTVGVMLSEKVLIIDPSVKVSMNSKIFLAKLNVMNEALFFLVCLSLALVAYKEYQEICFRRVIKNNKLDVIE